MVVTVNLNLARHSSHAYEGTLCCALLFSMRLCCLRCGVTHLKKRFAFFGGRANHSSGMTRKERHSRRICMPFWLPSGRAEHAQ
jgi:hypothetical protein